MWIWSERSNFAAPSLTIKLNNKLWASAIFSGEISTIDDPELPMYKSYRTGRSLNYTIHSIESGRYQTNMDFEELTSKLYEDIQKIHNRTVAVLRGRLRAWQLNPLARSMDSAKADLKNWETQYRNGDNGRFKEYNYSVEGGLGGLIESLGSLYAPRTIHVDSSKLEDPAEWLEENKPVAVTEELLAQAVEARKSNNLRLAIFNYIIALEQVTQEYLSKQLKRKLAGSTNDKRIKDFLRSDNTRFKDKLDIILRLLIHESWLRGIDFYMVNKTIEVRNKIAHGETITVRDKFGDVDWEVAFKNVEALIESLANATLLIDASDEIKAIAKSVDDAYDTYPMIWVHKAHKLSSEVTLYSGDPPAESDLQAIAATIAAKRLEQDSRFKANKHLVVTFVEYPKKRYATWKAGKISFHGV